MTELDIGSKSKEMSEGSEVRMGLVRHRVSQREFAERCGIGVSELSAMLDGKEELIDSVRNAYALLEVEGMEKGDRGGSRICWSGRAVRNPNLLVVYFNDGETGLVRKKEWFQPGHGMEMEVEPSEEESFWRLVGDYRPNGVRLDG